MPNQEEPALTLDRALWYGRTYRAHSASTAAETSPQFLKRLQKSQTKKSPTFLCLQTGGLIQDVSWEEDSALLGEFSMRSFLEYHNGGVESRLSQILQGGAAPEILFERESVSGHSEPCEAEKKRIAGDTADCAGTAISFLERAGCAGGGKGILIQDDLTGTLSTVNNQAACYGICSDKSNSMLSGNPHSGIYEADTSRTLDNNCGNPACNQGGIAVVEMNPNELCIEMTSTKNTVCTDGICPTLTARMGTGGDK